jgi:hypothetical protein
MNPEHLSERILSAELEFPSTMTPAAINLIAGLLCRNPMLRLGCGQRGFQVRRARGQRNLSCTILHDE